MYLLVVLSERPDLYVPDKYSVNGTLRLPLSTVAQPFTAKMHLSQNLGFVSYFNNLTYTVFAD